MYELKIEDKNRVWRTADLNNDAIPMSYQTNNIAELENRQANYSLTLKLPLSNNNCRIFDFADIPNVVSDFPYKTHECRLYANGFTLAGKGALLKPLRVSDVFECQILSGIADFFNSLKNKQMSELDLGSVVRLNSADLRGGNRQFQNNNGVILPVVFVHRVMNEICKQNGFELIHNLT